MICFENCNLLRQLKQFIAVNFGMSMHVVYFMPSHLLKSWLFSCHHTYSMHPVYLIPESRWLKGQYCVVVFLGIFLVSRVNPLREINCSTLSTFKILAIDLYTYCKPGFFRELINFAICSFKYFATGNFSRIEDF